MIEQLKELKDEREQNQQRILDLELMLAKAKNFSKILFRVTLLYIFVSEIEVSNYKKKHSHIIPKHGHPS